MTKTLLTELKKTNFKRIEELLKKEANGKLSSNEIAVLALYRHFLPTESSYFNSKKLSTELANKNKEVMLKKALKNFNQN